MPSYTSTGAISAPYKLLEVGEYSLKCFGAEEKFSSTGNEMIVLEWRTKDGGVIKDNLVFSEKSAWKVDQLLVAVGYELPKEGENVTIEPAQFLNQVCTAFVEHEQGSNGKSYNKIGYYITEGVVADKKLPKATVQTVKPKEENGGW